MATMKGPGDIMADVHYSAMRFAESPRKFDMLHDNGSGFRRVIKPVMCVGGWWSIVMIRHLCRVVWKSV